MLITCRIEESLVTGLEQVARKEGMTKSEILRRALREFIDRRTGSITPWELGKDLFGKAASGRSDLSTDRKRIFREIIRAKAKGRDRFGSPGRPV